MLNNLDNEAEAILAKSNVVACYCSFPRIVSPVQDCRCEVPRRGERVALMQRSLALRRDAAES